MRLYLEEATDGKALHTIERDELLIFFKLYNPHTQKLSFLGRCFVKKTHKLPDLTPLLTNLAQLPEGTSLEVPGTKPSASALHMLPTDNCLSSLPCMVLMMQLHRCSVIIK